MKLVKKIDYDSDERVDVKLIKKLLLLLLIIASAVAESAFAETDFKIITLQHMFANDLLPIITSMVGEDGAASGLNNQLIIRANRERMREIEATIASLDVTKVNRKITVKSTNNLQAQQERVEASGAIKVGKVTLGNDRRAKASSGRVDVEQSSSNANQYSNQFINVLDGERAFIKVGQIVPFTQEWVTITRRYIQIDKTVDWREITTGFAVRPRTVGNPNHQQIELEITPRIAKLNSKGYVDFEELTTTMRVNIGDWVDIGGSMQTNDDVSHKILSLQNSASGQKSNLIVKVE